MTLTAAKLGGWSLNEILRSSQMNALQNEVLKALDGVGGGTYAPSAQLVVNGSGIGSGTFIDVLNGGQLRVLSGGLLRLNSGGAMDVLSGSNLFVQSGGNISLVSGGNIDMNSGSTLTVDGGANVNVTGDINLLSGGQIDVESGGAINVLNGGAINFTATSFLNLATGTAILGASGSTCILDEASDYEINADPNVLFRSHMTPVYIDNDGAGNDFWGQDLGGIGQYRLQNVASVRDIRFALDVLPGDIVTLLALRLNGGAGAGHGGSLPATMPRLRVFRVALDGAVTLVAEASDTTGSAAAYDVAHSLVLNSVTVTGGAMPFTVTSDPHYVIVEGEAGANAVADTLQLTSLGGVITANRVRAQNEFH